MTSSGRPILSRRLMLAAGGLALAGAAGAGGIVAWLRRRPFEGGTLTAEDAHARAVAGDIWLIDIRRPDEWQETGVGVGAIPLDMRRPDFVTRLRSLTAEAPTRPVALICARGVRSSQLGVRLQDSGFGILLDVPEGMLGSRAGPGWIARDLPVQPPQAARRPA